MCDLTLGVGFSCSSGPDGGFLSDPVAPFLEETIEVPMWVGSFSSLSGSSTVDFFPVFPIAFSLGVVMGFELRRSGRLVASGSEELDSTQSFHSVCSLRHILAFCRELGPPLVPSPVAALLGWCLAALPFCLITAGLVSMDGPQLVSSAESQLC